MEVAGAWPHVQITRRHRFKVVVKHIRLRRHDDFKRAILAQEIRCQYLDRRGRAARADRANGSSKMFGTAIGEIVTVDRGNHDVVQPKLQGSLGYVLRLFWV